MMLLCVTAWIREPLSSPTAWPALCPLRWIRPSGRWMAECPGRWCSASELDDLDQNMGRETAILGRQMGMELAMAWCFSSSFIGGKWYQTNLGWSLQCLDVRYISLHRFHWWVSRMTGLSLVCLWTVGSWWESMWALKTTKLLTPVGYLIFRLIFFASIWRVRKAVQAQMEAVKVKQTAAESAMQKKNATLKAGLPFSALLILEFWSP